MLSRLLCCSSSKVSGGNLIRPYNIIQYEEETNFLHGTLKIHVIEARDLPDVDRSCFNIGCGCFNIEARDPPDIDRSSFNIGCGGGGCGDDRTDPFVVVCLDKTELCKTGYLKNNLNIVWDETFSVELFIIISLSLTFLLIRLTCVTMPRVSRSW